MDSVYNVGEEARNGTVNIGSARCLSMIIYL